MKLVIDLPEEKIEWVKESNPNANPNSIVGAIANGTPYEERPTEGDYESGWMDGYNHALDQIFKELNYLLKNHVIEELRKRIKR